MVECSVPVLDGLHVWLLVPWFCLRFWEMVATGTVCLSGSNPLLLFFRPWLVSVSVFGWIGGLLSVFVGCEWCRFAWSCWWVGYDGLVVVLVWLVAVVRTSSFMRINSLLLLFPYWLRVSCPLVGKLPYYQCLIASIMMSIRLSCCLRVSCPLNIRAFSWKCLISSIIVTMWLAWADFNTNVSVWFVAWRMVQRSLLSRRINGLTFFGFRSMDCWDRLPRCRRFFSTESKPLRFVFTRSFLRSCGVSAPGSALWPLEGKIVAVDLSDADLGHFTVSYQLTSIASIISHLLLISYLMRMLGTFGCNYDPIGQTM